MVIVYFIRHGHAHSNVASTPIFDTHSIRDATLTSKGILQSWVLSTQLRELGVYFNHILVSPQARALRTCEIALGHQLRRAAPKVLPELQESGKSPSSTPLPFPDCKESTGLILKEFYDWSRVEDTNDDWHQKRGLYATTPNAVSQRAALIRSHLAQLEGTVAIVAHGAFMREILRTKPSNPTSLGEPKGFVNCGWRKYSFEDSQFTEIVDEGGDSSAVMSKM